MSRHRYCPSNERDAFIEELAQQLWEEREAVKARESWSAVGAEVRQRYLNLAADTLRFLEHGHG